MDDVMLEEWLRRGLHDGESDLPPRPDLAVSTTEVGRRTVRRRRGYAAAGVATVVIAVVAAWASVAVAPRVVEETLPGPAPATPQGSVAPGEWVRSLPRGAAPRRTYLVGTVLHRPDGDVRLDGYDDAGMVGDTVAGTVVLGEKVDRGPVALASEYLLVAWSGEITVIADGTFTGAQEAVVSPDGRYFAHDRVVVDMSDLSVVEQIPVEAEVLIDWTGAGIRFWAGSRQMLWQPGTTPRRAEERDPSEFTRSPDGTRTITRRLQLRPPGVWLAGGPLSQPAPVGAHATTWEDDRNVLLTVASYVVRCDVQTGDCERATGLLPLAGNEFAQLSPTVR